MADALDRLTRRLVAAWSWGLPNWEGRFMDVGIFTPGQHGVLRPVPWQAFASASAPVLSGGELHFAVTAGGRTITKEHVSADAVAPLARALAEQLDPPFCAVAIHDEGDVWATAGSRALIIELADAHGSQISVSRVGGELTTQIEGTTSTRRFSELEALLDREDGDVTVIAHRFVGPTWVAEVFPL
jgi:hypothetical protein